MQIFYFKADTGEYLHSSNADESPLEPGVYLQPINATFKRPMNAGQNQVAVFRDDNWSLQADYRGWYYLPDGSKFMVSELGVLPPDGATIEPPATSRADQISRIVDLIKRERDLRWRSGFPVLIDDDNRWFPSDQFSLLQYIALKDKARDLLTSGGAFVDAITIDGDPVNWKLMDGSYVAITIKLAFDIVDAASRHESKIFIACENHCFQLNKSNDPLSYDYLSYWPLKFGE
jgi:hypothetical protein